MRAGNAALAVALSAALCEARVFAQAGPVAQWTFDE
jgi:hypothetical protein